MHAHKTHVTVTEDHELRLHLPSDLGAALLRRHLSARNHVGMVLLEPSDLDHLIRRSLGRGGGSGDGTSPPA
jgi:hypothetical protein